MPAIKRPRAVNILGKEYTLTYVDNPADVDTAKRKSLWGQVDYWTRTIRIYDTGRSESEIWHSLIHEIIHAIGAATHREVFNNNCDEDAIDCLALGLFDTFTRNGWLEIDKGGEE